MGRLDLQELQGSISPAVPKQLAGTGFDFEVRRILSEGQLSNVFCS